MIVTRFPKAVRVIEHTLIPLSDGTQLAAGIRHDASAVDYVSNVNGQAGGPIVKNKLFFFGSSNYQQTHVNVVGFPSPAPSYIATPLANTSVEDTTDILAGEAKFNYALNGRNRFEGIVAHS